MKTIDLHAHTTASDGTFSPAELVDYAMEKKLAALAITDHDTIAGIAPAMAHLGDRTDLELIPGIEISSNTPDFNCDIHILGFYIDIEDKEFIRDLSDIVSSRDQRNEKMVQKLCEIGIEITMQDVIDAASNGIITRAHFAKHLIEKGIVKNTNEAFSKYIGRGSIAYVPREKLTPQRAIELIRRAGGVASLAHPTLYNLNLKELDALIKKLTEYGLQGIEGIYSLYNKSEVKYLKNFANQYNLVITGGSDFHGGNKMNIDLGVGRGKLAVPYELLSPIRKLSNKNPSFN